MRQFWGIPDSVAISTVGTLPEALTEFGSMVSTYSEQLPKQTGWQVQLFAKESGIDSARIREKIDSLSALLNRIAAVAENSPELKNSKAVF